MGKIIAVNISEEKGTPKKIYIPQTLSKTGAWSTTLMPENGIARLVFYLMKK